MRKLLFPSAAVLALTLAAAAAGPARASWLSEALHAAADRDQTVTYYDPVAPYYYPTPTPAPVVVPVTPGYTYYETRGYVPYAYQPHYHGHWDRDHRWHEWHEHHDHR